VKALPPGEVPARRGLPPGVAAAKKERDRAEPLAELTSGQAQVSDKKGLAVSIAQPLHGRCILAGDGDKVVGQLFKLVQNVIETCDACFLSMSPRSTNTDRP
jgi:hypothetical protein